MTTLKVGQALATGGVADLGWNTYQVSTVAAGSNTLTLPTAVGQDGAELNVTRVDATNGSYTLATTGGQTINGVSSVAIQPLSSTTVFAMGNNWWVRNTNKAITAGGFVYVDAMFGNDSTGLRNREDQPFLTVSAGLAAASSGDTVLLSSGTFTVSTLTIPSGVALVGTGTLRTILSATFTNQTAAVVTMGTSSDLARLTINATATLTGANITGVLFPGTTGLTARMALVNLTIDVSGQSTANTITVTGVDVTSTGTTSLRNWVNAISCNVTVLGTGDGAKRALKLESGAGNFSVEDGQYLAVQVGAATASGSYGGLECASASGVLTLRGCACQGSLLGAPGPGTTAFDISQTLGSIEVDAGVAFLGTNATSSINAANSLNFTTSSGSAGWQSVISVLSTVQNAASTRYPSWGGTFVAIVANVTESVVQIRFSRPTVVRNLVVLYGSLPASGTTITISVSKNANVVAQPLAVTITNLSPAAPGPVSDLVRSVAFSTTDLIAVAVTNSSNNTGFANFRISLDC